MFRIGQRVICVNDRGEGRGALRRGEIYTVTALCPPGPDGEPGLRIAEALSPPERFRYGSDKGWRVTRFRPIVERKTDISIFTEMLSPTPLRVRDTTGA